MKRNPGIILVIVLLLLLSVTYLFFWKNAKALIATPGEVVELSFVLDKKFEFGEYYFDLGNGKSSTYPLCYCLTEKNTYPADCVGDIKYIYNNTPGTTCIPLNIGTGRCSAKVMNSSGHATMFLIPLEYQWTKPVEKIVLGISVPVLAPDHSKIVVEVTILKRDELGKLVFYRKLEQTIIVDQKKK